MTYHRTAGKGGTRNSSAERHPKPFTRFSKHTDTGHSRPARKGKTQLNPGTHGGRKRTMSY